MRISRNNGNTVRFSIQHRANGSADAIPIKTAIETPQYFKSLTQTFTPDPANTRANLTVDDTPVEFGSSVGFTGTLVSGCAYVTVLWTCGANSYRDDTHYNPYVSQHTYPEGDAKAELSIDLPADIIDSSFDTVSISFSLYSGSGDLLGTYDINNIPAASSSILPSFAFNVSMSTETAIQSLTEYTASVSNIVSHGTSYTVSINAIINGTRFDSNTDTLVIPENGINTFGDFVFTATVTNDIGLSASKTKTVSVKEYVKPIIESLQLNRSAKADGYDNIFINAVFSAFQTEGYTNYIRSADVYVKLRSSGTWTQKLSSLTSGTWTNISDSDFLQAEAYMT